MGVFRTEALTVVASASAAVLSLTLLVLSFGAGPASQTRACDHWSSYFSHHPPLLLLPRDDYDDDDAARLLLQPLIR